MKIISHEIRAIARYPYHETRDREIPLREGTTYEPAGGWHITGIEIQPGPDTPKLAGC
jgi:hypothetical protein